jgi:hypothetical protein
MGKSFKQNDEHSLRYKKDREIRKIRRFKEKEKNGIDDKIVDEEDNNNY